MKKKKYVLLSSKSEFYYLDQNRDCIWQNLCKISIPVKNHVVPDGPIFFTVKEWEDYFQFLSQIGAH